LTNEIVEACKQFSFNQEYYLKEVLDILLDRHWDIVWPILSSNILMDDFYGWYNLKSILKKYSWKENNKLIEWMDEYPQLAPQKAIEFVRIHERIGDQNKWSNISVEMLYRYPNNTEFLKTLSSELNSYMWSGSLVPILENRKLMFQELLSHSNPSIIQFATEGILYLENRILAENRNDENEKLIYAN
jgi:hypothetical protein